MIRELALPGRKLLIEAHRTLGNEPNIGEAITYARTNPHEFGARLKDFDHTLRLLAGSVSALGLTASEEDRFQNVVGFANMIQGRGSSIHGIDHINRWPVGQNRVREVVREVKKKIESGEWKFPREVIDNNQLISGLLVEGYGLYQGQLYDNPNVPPKFVLAFEEVLWDREQLMVRLGEKKSPLLQDILPWMIEEADQFAPAVRNGLCRLQLRKEFLAMLEAGIESGQDLVIDGEKFEAYLEALQVDH